MSVISKKRNLFKINLRWFFNMFKSKNMNDFSKVEKFIELKEQNELKYLKHNTFPSNFY